MWGTDWRGEKNTGRHGGERNPKSKTSQNCMWKKICLTTHSLRGKHFEFIQLKTLCGKKYGCCETTKPLLSVAHRLSMERRALRTPWLTADPTPPPGTIPTRHPFYKQAPCIGDPWGIFDQTPIYKQAHSQTTLDLGNKYNSLAPRKKMKNRLWYPALGYHMPYSNHGQHLYCLLVNNGFLWGGMFFKYRDSPDPWMKPLCIQNELVC